VLVTADGIPKLLDFGIAKLLAADDAAPAAVALTRVNDRLLTPRYASPEQILGRPVTTATDVYSLGTLLYELLTGLHPFGNAPIPLQLELERLISRSDPLPPSAAVKQIIESAAGEPHENLARIAAARQLSAQRLAQRLAGDLDAICTHALRKEPLHRYASVEQLANDIRRHLTHRPVTARRRTGFYRSARFVRCHALGVVATVAGIGVLVAFAVATSVHAKRIAVERDRAGQERSRAEAVSSFMLDVFGTTDPRVVSDERTARELLDHAAQRIDRDLSQQPEVQVRLLEAIGQTYRRQGYYARAVAYLERALQLRKRLPETDHVVLANTLLELAVAQRNHGALNSSNTNLLAAKDLLEADHERAGLVRARVLAALGRVDLERSDWRAAERYLAESVALLRPASTHERFELVDALRDLAGAQWWKGDVVAAEQTLREAVAISRAHLPPLHPSRISAEGQLADLLLKNARSDAEAAALLTSVLHARRTLYGRINSEVANTLSALAGVQERRGQWQKAEQLMREALDIQVQTLGSEHYQVGYDHTSLGVLLLHRGKPVEAERELRTALRIYAQSLSADHQYVASAEHVLGEILIAQSRYGEAEQVLIAARDRWMRSDAAPWRVARTVSALGEATYRQHRLAEGERLLLTGYRDLLSDMAAPREARKRSHERLVRLYRETGQAERLARLVAPDT
ncbi:MAG TPA: tetratricopeptide repeat protein, partial [Steroidobacteraceae bacterium]|nr:tetratricopeptide repeat protein [Steroidobacteraceae bacterium]